MTGEVELIGGWVQVAFADEFSNAADTSRYQVFVTSYDPASVFVHNRTPTGFEIHALDGRSRKPPARMSCAYYVLARRLQGESLDR